MQVKVDNVNKARTGFVSNEKWYNFQKGSDQVLDDSVKRGVTLELEMDGNFIGSYKVVSSAPFKAHTPRSSAPADPSRDAKIALGNAFNAVFAPVYTNLATKEGQSHEEAFSNTLAAVKEVAKMLTEAK